jgi:hypothetical protein
MESSQQVVGRSTANRDRKRLQGSQRQLAKFRPRYAAKNSEATMRKQPGWIFRKRYSRHAVLQKRRLAKRQLEAAIEDLVDRLIEKHLVEVTSDGKVQIRLTPQPRQSWPPTAARDVPARASKADD